MDVDLHILMGAHILEPVVFCSNLEFVFPDEKHDLNQLCDFVDLNQLCDFVQTFCFDLLYV